MIEREEPRDLAAAVAESTLNVEGEVDRAYRESVRQLGRSFTSGTGADAMEVAINAAVGVGWARLENGLRALEESNS